MNISKFFIDRPIFAGVLSVLILLAGLLSVFQLPISEYPEVVPPTVVVRAQYPGANPKVIAETVAAPLEESINGVDDMLYMQRSEEHTSELQSLMRSSYAVFCLKKKKKRLTTSKTTLIVVMRVL